MSNGGKCPACGESELAEWRVATASDPRLSARSAYRLARCRRCGTAVLADPAAESGALYSRGSYASARRGRGAALAPLRRLVDLDRRRLVGRLPAGSRVLDVGAGRGRLMADLVRAGHRVSGLEPSAALSAEAREAGAEVQTTSLERAELEPASFDAVVLWHALEHLEDPEAALLKVGRWLSPGGRLVVAVPNLAGLQARIGGDRWFHQDVPRHRVQFTVTGLEVLLARAGYRAGRPRHVLLDQNPLGMWLTLLNRLTAARDVPFRALKGNLRYARRRDAARDAAVVVLAGPLLVPVAVILELAAGLAGRGGTVAVRATHGGGGSQ